jgi:hypothetical protein
MCLYMCDKQKISPISTLIVLLIINMKIISNFEKKNCLLEKTANEWCTFDK